MAQGEPEILPPASSRLAARTSLGRRLFSDEWLDQLAHLLDDCFRIPGTPIRFGLDGLIGLIPGVGDVLAGLASSILILAAWLRGVPYITLVRMMVNLALDVVVGAIPVFGDLFDVALKANRRNYKLMMRHIGQPGRHTWRDWAFLWFLASCVVGILAVPVLLLAWILLWLATRHS